MVYVIDNGDDTPDINAALNAALNKAITEPRMIDILQKFVDAHLAKTQNTITMMSARLDQVLESVQHPELKARRITQRQTAEQMELARNYADAAGRTTDRDLRAGYLTLASRALGERAP